jgi:hypothetical protein
MIRLIREQIPFGIGTGQHSRTTSLRLKRMFMNYPFGGQRIPPEAQMYRLILNTQAEPPGFISTKRVMAAGGTSEENIILKRV